jgi:hypothetical protein
LPLFSTWQTTRKKKKMINSKWWILQSFEENYGKTSGKALTAFASMALISLSVVVALVYSENHILPEFMWWGIISLIGGLFGLKLFSGNPENKRNKKN